VISRMEPDALKQFIRDYMDNRIFTSADIRSRDEEGWARDMGMVFMPVMFGCLHVTIEVPEPPDDVPEDMTVEEWEVMRAEYPRKLELAKKAEDMAFKALTAELGVVWSYNKDALPRGVNGYPMFMSCSLMHKDDWEAAVKVFNKTRAALNEALDEGGEASA
jgi:hypothetical protein